MYSMYIECFFLCISLYGILNTCRCCTILIAYYTVQYNKFIEALHCNESVQDLLVWLLARGVYYISMLIYNQGVHHSLHYILNLFWNDIVTKDRFSAKDIWSVFEELHEQYMYVYRTVITITVTCITRCKLAIVSLPNC